MKQKFIQALKGILNHRWVLIGSIVVFSLVMLIAVHSFAIYAYSYCVLLGWSTGLVVISAFWLIYSIIKQKK